MSQMWPPFNPVGEYKGLLEGRGKGEGGREGVGRGKGKENEMVALDLQN